MTSKIHFESPIFTLRNDEAKPGKASWYALPSFASSSKIWPNFSNKVFLVEVIKKIILTKNVHLTYYSSMKKKIREIRMIFAIENSL